MNRYPMPEIIHSSCCAVERRRANTEVSIIEARSSAGLEILGIKKKLKQKLEGFL